MSDKFIRTELMLGSEAMERLKNARVAVFGLGGVGGYCVEALVRSGIGAIDIIDCDTLSVSNINRQIYATTKTVGMAKTEAARQRILEINPDVKLTVYDMFYLPETADRIDFSLYDYVVDAIDTITAKLEIIKRCDALGIPVISSMGTGNKLDPTQFEITDIYKTSVCPLAKVMRKLCKENGIKKLKVVYSKELPIKVAGTPDEETMLKKRSTPGSISFVPPVAGLIIAGEVIKALSTRDSVPNPV